MLSLSADVYSRLVRAGGLVVFGVFPWLVGRYRRQQVQLVESGWERAARFRHLGVRNRVEAAVIAHHADLVDESP
ncbi:hypothetical protein [Saccharothrix luteola]|uniref:hypothetical protein n=1 Tax=Saccharothrix luteola TaxID=2893018 RepID=UPI001E2C0474|nr:hypothetical protein [Saccharothrix luteola]